jgi:hypothetical protein
MHARDRRLRVWLPVLSANRPQIRQSAFAKSHVFCAPPACWQAFSVRFAQFFSVLPDAGRAGIDTPEHPFFC